MTCAMNRAIDLHFAGKIPPGLERELRLHLPTCEDCRAYYERHLVLSGRDSRASSGQHRVEQGLGIKERSKGALGGVAVFASAFVALLLLFLIPEEPPETEVQMLEVERYMEANDPMNEYAARGGGTAGTRVIAYRRPPVGKAQPLEGQISPEDSLAFAYENSRGWLRLMIFAVDEGNRVYWYYPEWTEPAANPTSISILTREGVHELPFSVHHTFEGSWLMVYTIFTDKVVSVREIEALLKQERALDAPLLENSQQETIMVKVKRK